MKTLVWIGMLAASGIWVSGAEVNAERGQAAPVPMQTAQTRQSGPSGLAPQQAGQPALQESAGTNAMRGQAAPAPTATAKADGLQSRPTATNQMIIEADGGFMYEATNWSFSEASLVNFPLLAGKLQRATDAVSGYLKGELSAATLEALPKYAGPEADPGLLPAALARDFNKIMGGKAIYDKQYFAGVVLRPETRQMLTNKPQGDALLCLNRLLLEDAYPAEISRVHPATAVYRVNVHVTDPQMEMYCEQLTVYFQTNNTIDMILAETNVVFMEKTNWAIGDKAVYSAAKDTVEVTGYVVLDDARGHMVTDRVIYDRKKGNVWAPNKIRMGGTVTGGTNSPLPNLFGTKGAATNAAPVSPKQR